MDKVQLFELTLVTCLYVSLPMWKLMYPGSLVNISHYFSCVIPAMPSGSPNSNLIFFLKVSCSHSFSGPSTGFEYDVFRQLMSGLIRDLNDIPCLQAVSLINCIRDIL